MTGEREVGPFRLAAAVLIQWTWGLLQNLAGLVTLFLLGRQPRERYRTAVVTCYHSRLLGSAGCFSLGMFIFIEGSIRGESLRRLKVHEYGHTVQSLILGPFFLIAAALPSALWNLRFSARRGGYRAMGVRYSDRYPENWANRLGRRVTADEPIDW